MRIVHSCNARLPVEGYGGTERVAVWLIKKLAEMGHHITVIAEKGTSLSHAEVIETANPVEDTWRLIPDGTDIIQYYATPVSPPRVPFIVYIGGNARPGERFYPNTVFVSRNHAERHGSSSFVYNGIDPDEHLYSQKKGDYFLFLSKVSRKVKGVHTAIRLAKTMGFNLLIAGGWRPSFSRKVRFVGEVTGRRKAELLAKAKALIFPIEWEEPFGLVVVEALISGTPVITTPRGAMPEIVTPEVGFICNSFEQMCDAVRNIDSIEPEVCRRVVMSKFTSEIMAREYLDVYERVLKGERLNPWKDTLS